MTHSYKGGSGKTLISINIADLLMLENKKVLLIEADFTGPAFQSIFPLYPDMYLNDFLETEDVNLEKYIHTHKEMDIIFCNPNFKAGDMIHGTDQQWFLRKKVQMQKTLKNIDYDYVIFDTSPGFNLFVVNLLSLADIVLLVSRLDRQSQGGLKSVIDNIYAKSIQLRKGKNFLFNIIINQIPRVDQMKPIIDNFEASLKFSYDFIDSIIQLPYDDTTGYHTTTDEILLPEDDPTKKILQKKVLPSFFVSNP